MSQEDLIQKHLEDGKDITPMEALNKYGCFRLGARIWTLIHKKNIPIQKEIVHDEKSDKHYARYWLPMKKQLELFPEQR